MYSYKNYNNGLDSFKRQIKMHNNKNIIGVPNKYYFEVLLYIYIIYIILKYALFKYRFIFKLNREQNVTKQQ